MGPERTVLIIDHAGVLISGVEDVLLWQSIVSHLAPVACVHNKGVSVNISGSGLEGLLCRYYAIIYIKINCDLSI